ncbi:hypothetical protein ACOME3_003777 [Neoechinorhynchus agilis]
MELSDKKSIVNRLRESFDSGKTRPYEWRVEQLHGIERFLAENNDEIRTALYSDLKMCERQVDIMEIYNTLCEVKIFIKKLRSWMQAETVTDTIRVLHLEKQVIYEPLGVVLVIGPWNYPLQLCLFPIIGALSSGNSCILKPSEIAVATEDLLYTQLPKYLDNDCFAVVKADGPETSALINENKFDYIFFTGSTRVGRIILENAAKQMCPVTLECGGKSPCLVCADVNLAMACR